MKNLLLLSAVMLVLASCGEEKEETQRTVKFTLTGTDVTEAKFNYKSTISAIKTPFTGSWDTTVYANIGETLSLDAKATGGTLKGQVFVGGVLNAEQIDADADGDGKTQVKVALTVK